MALAARARSFAVGDRVRVAGRPHMPGQRSGEVAIVNGNAYGIRFDGSDEIHKWYTAEELRLDGGEKTAMHDMNRMGSGGKRKPLALMIAIGAKKKPGREYEGGDDDEEMPEEEAPDDGRLAACEDMIDAFKNRDAAALDRAMANWCTLYKGHDDE